MTLLIFKKSVRECAHARFNARTKLIEQSAVKTINAQQIGPSRASGHFLSRGTLRPRISNSILVLHSRCEAACTAPDVVDSLHDCGTLARGSAGHRSVGTVASGHPLRGRDLLSEVVKPHHE